MFTLSANASHSHHHHHYDHHHRVEMMAIACKPFNQFNQDTKHTHG
ncbi:MAG: hypothetical protein VKJ04_06950 [Vampirovibrionales bacterium]|nr:hypothetical protein [Vampirovibrionales bacterium]